MVGLVSDEGRFTVCCYERSWPFRREKASRDVVKSVDGGGKTIDLAQNQVTGKQL